MRALLIGYYGTGNLGDELMLYCLRHWLQAQDIEIDVLSEHPEAVVRSSGLVAIKNVPLLGEWGWKDAWLRGKAFRLIRSIRSYDLVIGGGGDLLRDDRGWRSLLYATEKFLAAAALRRPVFLVNVGVGQPHSRHGRALLKLAVRSCRRIIVRDKQSLRVCQELGGGAFTEHLPEIVLSLPAMMGALPPVDLRPPYLAVCLKGQPNEVGGYALGEDRLSALAAVLDRLSEQRGLQIRFVPFQEGADDRDAEIHESTARRMRCGRDAVLSKWSDDIVAVSQTIAGARGVLAMRLHAGVLAAAFGRPCVLMPYDRKVVEFGREMALEPFLTPELLDSPDLAFETVDAALRAERLPDLTAAQSWRSARLLPLSTPPHAAAREEN